MTGLVIIGGSYAGFNVAISARQHGYAETIRMLVEEPVLPYHRPPLSKGYLLNSAAADTLAIRGAAFYAEHDIDVLFGTKALAIDSAHRVVTNRGTMDFDVVAITTGARARSIKLPGSELEGVVTLRNLADAEAIRHRLAETENVVLVGAGFIGLELAASLRKLGKAVTVLEAQSRVLARAIPPRLSAFIEAEHRRHGVDLRCNIGVSAIQGAHGKVNSVVAADGARFPADMVVLAAWFGRRRRDQGR